MHTLSSSLNHCFWNCSLYMSLIGSMLGLVRYTKLETRPWIDWIRIYVLTRSWVTQMHVELWEALPWPDMHLIPVTTFIYHMHTEFIYKYKHYKRFYRKLYLEFWTKGEQKMKISYRTHLWNNFPPCISGSVWMWVHMCVCVYMYVCVFLHYFLVCFCFFS